MSSHDDMNTREKERMKKKLVILEKALESMASHKPPPISGWILVSEVRVAGPTSASTYLEFETRTSKVRTETRPAQLAGNTVAWKEELALWVDSQAEELMFLLVRNHRHIHWDDVVGRPIQIDLKRIPTNATVMQQVDNGTNGIQIVMQMRPANPRHKPTTPKGGLCDTVGDFNIPDARMRLKKGGVNDYCEFVPTVGRKYERGTISDYADFIVPSYGNTYKMKRGGLNDYAEFVLPRGYREQHGGINDYFTC